MLHPRLSREFCETPPHTKISTTPTFRPKMLTPTKISRLFKKESVVLLLPGFSTPSPPHHHLFFFEDFVPPGTKLPHSLVGGGGCVTKALAFSPGKSSKYRLCHTALGEVAVVWTVGESIIFRPFNVIEFVLRQTGEKHNFQRNLASVRLWF